MERYHYGIDFGTSNSALTIFDNVNNSIITTITEPSIIYFPKEQNRNKELAYYIGKKAVEHYISDGMTGRFMKSIKRVLPRSSFVDTRIFSKKFDASDLVSLIIKDLKGKADKIIGEECTSAIIGRPVYFDDDNSSKDELAEKRLSKALKIAGFTNFQFQFEPIAAAFAYEKTIQKNEKVIVADFGGGTTDFTFINLRPQDYNNRDRKNDIKATGGIYIGGDSFDSAFMYQKGTPHFGRGAKYESRPGKYLDLTLSLFTNICTWEKMNFFNSYKIKDDLLKYYTFTGKNQKVLNLITLIDKNLGYQIFKAVEQTKIDLSDKNQSYFEFSKFGIEILDRVTLDDYNLIIKSEIDKIKFYFEKFVIQNQINLNEIDSVFITGGSSLVKAIKNIFFEKISTSKIKRGDDFYSVAQGLAYSGYLLNS